MSPVLPFQFNTEYQRAKWESISEASDHLIEEGMTLPSSPWTLTAALLPKNRSRNRYTNVLPWDLTRVKLKILAGGSDYINALRLCLDDKTYIAAQGPLPATVHHFWAMCFHQAEESDLDTVAIMMLTPLQEKGVVKCSNYWPLEKEPVLSLGHALEMENLAYTDLEVRWVKSIRMSHFILTDLELTTGNKSKKVKHYYYDRWEDSMPPSRMSPLAALADELRDLRSVYPGIAPIVHCSAGVGRTGTLIAYDYLREDESLLTKSDPVFETVLRLREQRMMMIQTQLQFRFLYDVAKNLAAEYQSST